MKVRFSYDGEEIEVDKIIISTNEEDFIIKASKNAYADCAKIELTKSSYEKSSTISITPSVSNLIYIK